MDTVSAVEACRITGLTYRQIDYLDRCRVYRPHVQSRGSGFQRRYERRQLPVLRLLARLRSMGVTSALLITVANEADRLEGLSGTVLVTVDGVLRPVVGSDDLEDGYVVRLGPVT